ncbi:MAG: DUF4838 domain-containing protein [Sediminibacterium sp.]
MLYTIQCTSQSLQLSNNGSSSYKIFLPLQPTAIETKSASVLQDYFFRVTGVRLPTEKTMMAKQPGFMIGHTNSTAVNKEADALTEDGFIIKTDRSNIIIAGKNKGTLYGVYTFIEKYMECRKWDGHKAITPFNATLTVPASIEEKQEPVIKYREVYFPAAFDNEYLDWHKLHRFENDWGLWGHSFFKLVPPSVYFKSNPQYFSLVDGRRQALQLCLSNPDVLKIAVAGLQKIMREQPNVKYWSVSPNDDIGNCECDACSRLDNADGGPQGSLLYFVNSIAAKFPGKIITTLAYGYTARAPIKTRAASNVVVMLSSIDAYRSVPLQNEPSARPFRNELARWKEKTDRLFVWNYCTQFTNYLTPFPIMHTFSPDINFMLENGVAGIFEQGSANTYSDLAELKSYLLAKLLWDPGIDVSKLTQDFLDSYYGKAAPAIADYISLIQKKVSTTVTRLDIYGNPVNDHAGYLSPENMDQYSSLMDKAEDLAENDTFSLRHIQSIRLSQDYVYLQQLKFFGKDPHGLLQKNNNGDWVVRDGLQKRITNFTFTASANGVKELSEGGITPGQYADEWKEIINTPPRQNLAANAIVRLSYPFAPEYQSKKERTLVDETPGYNDFSYNWLCFYEVPMEAIIDMGELKSIKRISMRFLEDPRHWIFTPSSVGIEISKDGIQYQPVNPFEYPSPEENYTIRYQLADFTFTDNIRYIRVKAANRKKLPAWRYHKYKKTMIACDEIWVE